jgi:hypothetical protein
MTPHGITGLGRVKAVFLKLLKKILDDILLAAGW